MCTSLVAAEKATADGSFIVTRSADSAAIKAQHFIIHPAKENQSGEWSTRAHQGVNDFTWPLPKQSLRYTTIPFWKTGVHGAAGFNEAGLGVTGTESIFASEEALAVDPYVKETGVTEDDIADVILSECRTAREGVLLLGRIIEEKGAGEGFGVAFVDTTDVWYLETGSGHQWFARRIPAEHYFASGNQGRFGEYDPDDPSMLASKSLVSFAAEKGLYNPDRDGVFNFSRAYTRDDSRDRTYNDPRVWVMQKRFNPSLVQAPDAGRTFPVTLAPEKKVTVADARAVMREHYEGTEHDPYGHGLRGDEPWRSISVFRTYEAHVLHVRPWLPKEIGEVLHVAMGMADLSVFLPFYAGLSRVPESWTKGTDQGEADSAYWKFRRVQTLAMTDYPKLAPIVKEAYAAYEAKTDAEAPAMEAEYLDLIGKDAAAAQKVLDDWNLRVITEAEELAEKLLAKLFVIRTADIEALVPGKNRKNKD
ncbi:C69 family dipeptidase [Sutterella sp.]|uniref:C69 family dipeptidase n=1 Tax=Sutterella sp. TaxID=1981025 RepID=UPI0026E0EE75|nr:C69 family dipeptidase [Sutterella sp.]MDO5531453.1 C69 family dipeptidase [Sutterella sp.]